MYFDLGFAVRTNTNRINHKANLRMKTNQTNKIVDI